jgi:hypothetical protein
VSTALVARRGTYGRLAELPLRIDGYELTGLELAVSEQFTRLTTVVRLHGGGDEGLGEDTTYAPPDQLAFRAAGPGLPVGGDWTIESAALDLALRQAGLPLAAVLGRVPLPVSFVVSPGPASSADPRPSRAPSGAPAQS